MNKNVDITQAKDTEAQAAADIMRQAAEWLIDRNARQWTPELFTESWAQKHIEAGELLVARSQGRIVGIAVLDNEDKIYWKTDNAGDSLYLHKIAVVRDFAGQKVAHKIIAWAMAEAQRKGCQYLRLNCWPRPQLIKLYLECGFEEVYRRNAQDDRGMPCETVGMQRYVGGDKPLTM